MRALVFGETGQVARELARVAAARGIEATFLGRAAADLSDPEACARAVRDARAEVVINAAAYTAVDRAEDEPELARLVNAEAPRVMAAAAAAIAPGASPLTIRASSGSSSARSTAV